MSDSDDDEKSAPDSDDESDDGRQRHFSFPELDEQIRACITEYGAVFPKMNFSSPKDASWVLPAGSPLKCTCPADVYLLLKSSDFISHDLSKEDVFDGCNAAGAKITYDLELVLRKWYPVDRSRELRCFVWDNTLFAISQRDTNFYDFMNEPSNQAKIVETLATFFKDHIQPKMLETSNYVFDFLLTRDYSSGHIIDFNPYLPTTDPLLYTYEELLELHQTHPQEPKLLVIDSAAHPAANTSGPANQHNMMPFDALNLSSGKDIAHFAEVWKTEVQEASKP